MFNIKSWYKSYLSQVQQPLPPSLQRKNEGISLESDGSALDDVMPLPLSPRTREEIDTPSTPSSREDDYQVKKPEMGETTMLIDPYDHDQRSKFVEEDSAWTLFKYNKRGLMKRIITRGPYYLLPISLWLPAYDWKKNTLADLVAGIGIGCMLIPQALAYALLAGVSPEVGLYTSLIPVYIFMCLTSSHHVSFGPDALASLLVGLYMQKHSNYDVDKMASVYAFMVGVVLTLMGIFRVGFLDNILSRPLLSGFVNAVAVIIIVLQLHGLFGLKLDTHSHHPSTIDRISDFFSQISNVDVITTLLGLLCCLILFGLKLLRILFPELKFIKFMIGPLIVVIVGIIISYTLNLESRGVVLLGKITSGFPTPSLPPLEHFQIDWLLDVIIICFIGFVEAIVSAKIYAKKHNYQISPNRELVALGVSNLLGSFFHTYPTFGSLIRSAMVDYLGNKTQLFSFVSATMVLFTILFLDKVFYFLPRVVMSAILLVAACSLFEFEELLFFYRVRAWTDIILMGATFLVTLLLGVDLGILISIGFSILMVLKHTTFPHIAILAKNLEGQYVDIYMDKNTSVHPGIVIVRIDESLYFANMEQIKDMFKRIEHFGTHYAHPTDKKEETPLRAIIVHAKNITKMDASAMMILWEMIEEYQKNNIFLCFVKLPHYLKIPFLKSGIIGSFGGNRVFGSIEEAIAYIKETVIPREEDLS